MYTTWSTMASTVGQSLTWKLVSKLHSGHTWNCRLRDKRWRFLSVTDFYLHSLLVNYFHAIHVCVESAISQPEQDLNRAVTPNIYKFNITQRRDVIIIIIISSGRWLLSLRQQHE